LFLPIAIGIVIGTALLRARSASGMGNAPTDRWGEVKMNLYFEIKEIKRKL
jgi:hypothetical protein